MKVSRRHKIGISLSLLAASALFTFQNCSKPTLKVTEISSQEAAAAATELSVPVDTTQPSYIVKSYEKYFSVNSTSNKVDVLVVIDNSGSMNYEQQNMASRFDKFLDKLSGLDWQVGIVTTDVSSDANLKDGRLIKFDALNKYTISSQDSLDLAKMNFAATIQRSESGASAEQGIKATYRALERTLSTASGSNNPNSVLLREGAALSVIVVTDADETGSTDKNDPLNLYNYVKQNFSNKVFKFSSIIVKPNDFDCKNDRTAYMTSSGNQAANSNETYGLKYKELTDMTSGVLGTVCAQDFGDQLSVIGQNTADQVKEVILDCAPIDTNKDGVIDLTIATSVVGGVVPSYQLIKDKIIFSTVLDPADYRIKYSCNTAMVK